MNERSDTEMLLYNIDVGVAITGSFCTYETIFTALEKLVEEGADVTAIFSTNSATTDSRFGDAEAHINRAREITKKEPLTSITQAEPVGPKKMFDILMIAPCTGNTLAKLANGITDTPVLMAAKSHLRNNRPLVIYLSSNDSLSMNLKNIGLLMNMKNIFFVPFGQDNYITKPNSMISHEKYILPAILNALEDKQIQPVIYTTT